MNSSHDEKSIKALASKLKKAREKQNLTQAELAEKAGIHFNYYARVERGEVNPSYDTLYKLIKALKVKSSDILPF
jgi:XRE family transcriptional regulator, regulator of sulfur utilization